MKKLTNVLNELKNNNNVKNIEMGITFKYNNCNIIIELNENFEIVNIDSDNVNTVGDFVEVEKFIDNLIKINSKG